MASKNKKPKKQLKDVRGKGLLFKFTCFLVRCFYKKRVFEGMENLPDEPCIIIANHAQYHGPVTGQLYYPRKKLIWSTGEMVDIKEVADYTFTDFWSTKPKYIRWIYRLASYIIAPLCVYYFSRADTISVYKDARLRNTFKDTMDSLNEGNDVLIFPEGRNSYNHVVNDFQNKFVDVAVLYNKKYKKNVIFVPMYLAAKMKKCVFGKPIEYDPNIKIDEQRDIICTHLKEEITNVALSLPAHIVVPYDNIPKKLYRKSK